jgi:hypothetical protein
MSQKLRKRKPRESLVFKHLSISDIEHFVKSLAVVPLGNANAQVYRKIIAGAIPQAMQPPP